MTSKITAIVLAAGISKRMGRPKMVLPWGLTSVLGQVVQVIAEAGVHEILVVTGGDKHIVESEILRLTSTFPVRSVFNENYETGGMMSSVQAGVRAISPESNAVLIALGDQPQIKLDTIIQVISCHEKTMAEIVVPSYNKKRGHPILISVDSLPALEAFGESRSLRDYLNSKQDQIEYVDADASILMDIDTPDDYQLYSKGKG